MEHKWAHFMKSNRLPAAHLAKDQKLEHISKTVHLTGDEDALNEIAKIGH